jgi:nuclear transport factor 2 (NTF2) superfamily protein
LLDTPERGVDDRYDPYGMERPVMSDLLEFARRYTEAWCSGEPARVAEHYSPDASLTINDASPAIGREAITEAARGFMDGFPDLRVAMEELKVGGDSPEYHWALTGTNTGPGGTGRAVRISGFERWTIGDDGLIAASLGSYDEADWDRQINGGPES